MSKVAKLRGLLSAAQRILADEYDVVIAYQAAPSIVVGLVGLFARRTLKRIVHQTTIPPATAAPVRLLDQIVGTVGLYPVNIVNTVSTQNE
jgi:ABC-type xylose transport system permease subunit